MATKKLLSEQPDYTLKGLNKYHLYVAHSLSDGPTVEKLVEGLARHKIKCFTRHSKGQEATNQTVKGRIASGVLSSQKCLVLLTENYLEDNWRNIEMEEVMTKGHRFSSDCVIIIKDKTANIPEPLKDFAVYSEDVATLINDCKALAEHILRAPRGTMAVLPRENMGHGSALGYFYGYLKLVLPDFKQRLMDQLYGTYPEMMGTTVKKMLIIIPKSCLCPPSLNDSGKIEFADRYVIRLANRAGNMARDFKSSVFKLIDVQRKKEYYFVAELATPLLTMYETFMSGLANMTLDQLYQQREVFAFTLEQIFEHPKNRECNGQFRILWWNDDKGIDGELLEPLYDYLLPVLREEIDYELDDVRDPQGKLQSDDSSVPLQEDAPENLAAPSRATVTYEPIESKFGSNPHDYYDTLKYDCYNFTHNPRGKCIIINIANFHKSDSVHANQLSQRRGADQDAIQMQALFSELKFEVELHQDVNLRNFEQILLTAHLVDHSRYDAFVCVIMTHGKLGVVFTSDGEAIRVLEIVDYFSDRNCPSLKGKPKMFFIQACQRGLTGTEALGNQMQADRTSRPANAVNNIPHSSMKTDEVVDTMHLMNELNITKKEDAEKVELEIDAEVSHRGEGSLEVSENGDTNTENPSDESIREESENLTVVSTAPEPYTPSLIGEGVLSQRPAGAQDNLNSIDSNEALHLQSSISGEQKAALVPGAPDFLMSYSTLPGSISYRDTVAGSLYISALGKFLKQNIEIDRALKMVTSEVGKKLLEKGELDRTRYHEQLPFHLTTGMSKLLYLAQKAD